MLSSREQRPILVNVFRSLSLRSYRTGCLKSSPGLKSNLSRTCYINMKIVSNFDEIKSKCYPVLDNDSVDKTNAD